MTNIQSLSARIAALESKVDSLSHLRVKAAEQQAEMEALAQGLSRTLSGIREGEQAERTLAYLTDVAERTLSAGESMHLSPEAEVPAAPAAESEQALQEGPEAPAPAEDDVQPEPTTEQDEPESEGVLEPELEEAPVTELTTEADEPQQDDEAEEAPVTKVSADDVIGYLRANPGSLAKEIGGHFGIQPYEVGMLLGDLKRAGKAEVTLGRYPRWSLTGVAPAPTEQPEPLPELPAEPQPAGPSSTDGVSEDDISRVHRYLLKNGNKTRKHLANEFRREHDWSEPETLDVIQAGIDRGLLTVVGERSVGAVRTGSRA